MTDEEKQAYNYLEKYIEWETFGERNLEGDIKTILNLIDKQQKEIDFFRNNNCCFESTEQGLYAIQLKPENYVPKDKIKEKIDLIDKEYAEFIEKNKNDLYLVNINAQRHNAMQTILEELLGE